MEFLNDLNGKMSKSNGDFLTLAKIENLGYSAIEYRYFLLLASYRKQINFSYTLLDSAKNGYEKLLKKIALLSDDNSVNDSIVNDYKDRILSIINNDFNTAGVLVLLQDLLKTSINDSTKIKIIEFIDVLLGLKFIENVSDLKKSNTERNIPDEIKKLAVQRQEFQKLKNYQAADELRNKIIFSGYNIIDTKDGFILTMKK